jgi:hypothetical protein
LYAGLKHVDVIKIDAEGADEEVLRGAYHTLTTRGVWLIQYEAGHMMTGTWLQTISTLDTDFGFDCYQNGESDVMVRVTRCWDESLTKTETKPVCGSGSGSGSGSGVGNKKCPILYRNPNDRIDGNGYCVHRTRAPALAAMFDSNSLHRYANGSRGHIMRDGLVGMPWAQFQHMSDGSMEIVKSKHHEDGFEGNYGRHIGGDFMSEWA